MTVTLTSPGRANVVHVVDHVDFCDVLISSALSTGPIAIRVRLDELDGFIEAIEAARIEREDKRAAIRALGKCGQKGHGKGAKRGQSGGIGGA